MVVTGDESRLYGYDVETIAQSSQWKTPEEPRPKKSTPISIKSQGFAHCFLQLPWRSATEVVRLIRTITLKLCTGCIKQCKKKRNCGDNSWLLHHGNAPGHSSLIVFFSQKTTLQSCLSHHIHQMWFVLNYKLISLKKICNGWQLSPAQISVLCNIVQIPKRVNIYYWV